MSHALWDARARALPGAARARDDVTSRASPRVCISARRNAFAGHSDLLRAPRVVSRSRASSSRGNPTRAALGGIRLLKFDPKRCSVFFLDTDRARAAPNRERRYTLTHNDLTRHLTMSVAPDFNGGQTDVWVTRLLRDEVLAEWREDGLHVHCFVSVDGHWWLKWAKGLRALVFRQKLPLVLDTLRYAERELLEAKPDVRDAPVYVHFHENRRRRDIESGGRGVGRVRGRVSSTQDERGRARTLGGAVRRGVQRGCGSEGARDGRERDVLEGEGPVGRGGGRGRGRRRRRGSVRRGDDRGGAGGRGEWGWCRGGDERRDRLEVEVTTRLRCGEATSATSALFCFNARRD